MKDFWQALAREARVGLVAGVIAIVVLVALCGWWMLRTEYEVLFADLKPQDASVMTAEMDRLKIPYLIGGNGTSLLVDKASVHATRIKLMGSELPLNGAVGFELFNNTDFGMTEFAQKINYQRALQGELTRTILSLSEVRDARVHLALPEQSLFKQATSRSKASITLTLRQGQALRAEQVSGIQRLVAAAVPGMTMQDVTILDNQGVALSRAGGDADADAGGRLDLKREAENYLSRKAGAVLERAFGPGQALASVDVTLNMDQIRVTTEDVIPAPQTRAGQQAAGVVVRERESARELAAPLDTRVGGTAAGGGTMQREVEYQVGRRVEQVVSQPGSIRRIQVVAVVRRALDARQEEQVRKLVAAAVGASPERGDAVVVQTMEGLPASTAATAPAATDMEAHSGASGAADTAGPSARLAQYGPWALVLALGMAIAGLLVALARRRSLQSPDPQPMTEAQRQAALERVQEWMRQGSGSAT